MAAKYSDPLVCFAIPNLGSIVGRGDDEFPVRRKSRDVRGYGAAEKDWRFRWLRLPKPGGTIIGCGDQGLAVWSKSDVAYPASQSLTTVPVVAVAMYFPSGENLA
jgi:hypothetical protein